MSKKPITIPKLHILLIEDDQNDAELLLPKVKRHAVKHVATMKSGLLALGTGRWDVVMLDLKLPNGHKETVLWDINKCRGDAATVIITGDCNPAMRDAMLSLGADGFLRKGIDDKTIVEIEYVLAVALEHRKGIK